MSVANKGRKFRQGLIFGAAMAAASGAARGSIFDVAVVAQGSSSVETAVPDALANMLAARQKVKTGKLVYSVHRADVAPGRLAHERAEVQFCESGILSRFVLVPPDGTIDLAGQPLSGERLNQEYPKEYLILGSDGIVWDRYDNSMNAHAEPEVPERIDVRRFRELGCSPYPASSSGIDLEGNGLAEFQAFHVAEEGGVVRITGTLAHGGARVWWIDPARDWSAIRVRDEEGDGWHESRISLERSDGVWYPREIACYRSHFRNGREPAEVVRIHVATLNQPGLKSSFVPEDIGVEPGTNITLRLGGGRTESVRWNGKKLISIEEFREQLRTGALTIGPTVKRLMAAAEARDAKNPDAAFRGLLNAFVLSPTSELSAWERYVLRFIQDHRLDSDQQAAAWRILQDCQEQANLFLHRRAEDFAEVERELALLREHPETATPADLDRTGQRYLRLLGPVREIFEQQLKPRLDKLPTRAQRAATQPASNSDHP